ncbi:protein SGT1ecdysoneless-like [Tropilaelaps mercedesae]|uniref:Protein SGT1ecdysoneless-like n=1 Tax=Tropilaelaps mercedesae TaxID=418985 RepID=A0A1V9Y3H7_9ACAR|nr:protein SGT1ecdysoneless-like [Tropilaelaps mercedesae]
MAQAVRTAEDTVRYRVFCSLGESSDASGNSPGKGGASPVGPRAILERRLAAIEDKVRIRVADYMWHVERFNLKVVDSPAEVGLEPHLAGSVFYGENVDDEWFVAHLFFELTRDDNDLVVQVDDEDGDIFLIEAANVLPRWLTPENGDNRVYLHRGVVHIVPESAIPEEELTIKRAVSFVRATPAQSVASAAIQQAVRGKTKDFESAEVMRATKLHRATVALPVRAAAFLRDDPALVADAARAFALRTPLDDRALRAMKHFPPEVLVRRSLLLTRFNYALLRHERCIPNPLTGWKIPGVQTNRNSPEFIEADLGMKLACGLEILCVALEEKKASIDTNTRFLYYVRRLKERNYFQGNLEFSEKYKELYNKAKEYFLQQDNDGEDPETSHQPRTDFLERLQTLQPDLVQLTEDEKDLLPPDSERWLELDDAELNKLLAQYTQGAPGHTLQEAFNSSRDESLAQQITQGLEDFMKHASGHEGIVAPSVKAGPSVNGQRRCRTKNRCKTKRGKKTGQTPGSNSSQPEQSLPPKKIDAAGMNVEDMSNLLNAVLDFKIPSESEEDSSSMSSYGDENTSVDIVEGLARDMQQYMSLMDKELSGTTMGQSFERVAPRAAMENWDDDVPAVDIPLTALKNILKSTSASRANPGPAQNLLHSMGVHVPPDLDSDDDPEPTEQ